MSAGRSWQLRRLEITHRRKTRKAALPARQAGTGRHVLQSPSPGATHKVPPWGVSVGVPWVQDPQGASVAGMAGLKWVPMLFRAGFVSSERLESKSSKLAAQGTGVELGDPLSHLPPPLELHTPLGQSQHQNMLEALPNLCLAGASFSDQAWQLDLGWGNWGTHPPMQGCDPSQREGRQGAAACFSWGGQCLIPDSHRYHQRWGCAVPWHHAPTMGLQKAKGWAASGAHESLSLLPCHWLFSSVGHQLLGQKFRWQMLSGKHCPAPTWCGATPISPG